jgi:hypothetical protein
MGCEVLRLLRAVEREVGETVNLGRVDWNLSRVFRRI